MSTPLTPGLLVRTVSGRVIGSSQTGRKVFEDFVDGGRRTSDTGPDRRNRPPPHVGLLSSRGRVSRGDPVPRYTLSSFRPRHPRGLSNDRGHRRSVHVRSNTFVTVSLLLGPVGVLDSRRTTQCTHVFLDSVPTPPLGHLRSNPVTSVSPGGTSHCKLGSRPSRLSHSVPH